MKNQPDFKKLFYDFFGSKPKKVTYSIRHDSNRYHDLIFLTSLIHDARFKRSDIKRRGKKLTILLNRDCWELGFVKHEKSSELYITNSLLSISPVVNIEWRYNNESKFNPESELWIHDVIIQRESFTTLKVVLDGDGWSLHLNASDVEFKMGFYDLEVPYLYSQKTSRTNKSTRALSCR
jgi:hypothetical protein